MSAQSINQHMAPAAALSAFLCLCLCQATSSQLQHNAKGTLEYSMFTAQHSSPWRQGWRQLETRLPTLPGVHPGTQGSWSRQETESKTRLATLQLRAETGSQTGLEHRLGIQSATQDSKRQATSPRHPGSPGLSSVELMDRLMGRGSMDGRPCPF